MKKLFTFSVLTLLLSISVLAQIPQAFKYQAVLRDASGQVLANQEVVISVSILQGSALGAEVFAESHELATNGFGLVNLSIGEIEPIMFSSIDWSMGPYFVKIAVDGIEMGTSQLLSVPYALHAGSVENDMTEDADADPTNELQTWATLPGIPADIADGDDIEDADADPTNELQTWGTLPDIPADIANGDDVEDADADPLNELQVLSISNDTIFLENGGFVKLPSGFDGNYSSLSGTPENLSDFNNDLGFVTSAEDADADPTNELQDWSTLPGIPTDFADGDDVEDADADPANELQTWGTLPGIPADIADGDDVDDADADPTNELQDWSTLPGIPANIADGDDIEDADADSTNELNTNLELVGSFLKVTDNGGELSVDLSSLIDDNDSDPTNELQEWGTLPGIPDDIADGDDVDDADADPTNELQSWGTLPGIPADLIDGDDVDDADADPTNELNTNLELVGSILKVTDNGGELSVDLSSLIDDNDSDPTNELQEWGTLPGIPDDIADGDDLEDADADPSNELNTNLELVGSFLKVTDNGGELSVDLSSLINDNDSDPTNELQSWSTLPGIPADIADGDDVDDADSDPTNELQVWGTLPGIPNDIADGDDVEDADADPTNELNTNLELVGTFLKVTDNGGELSVDLSSLIDDNDSDPTNELQEWGTLPGIPDDIADGDDVEDADSDPTNELQSWGTLPGIPADLVDGDDVNDADADPTNELQDISLSGTELSITGGSTVDLSALGTDNQTLSINFDEISIENGNTIKLPEERDPQVGPLTTGYVPVWNSWRLENGSIFDNGNIGIGTTTPGANLEVAGGILHSGGNSVVSPGLIFYDDAGSGAFKYFDNTNTEQILGGTSTTNYLWHSSSGDIIGPSDVIVQSSLAVGMDAVPGENFGFATILLKENNTRIKFEDTSVGSFPSNDWMLVANSSSNGGENYFAIQDFDSGNLPFLVRAGAPNNSLYVAPNGNVGIGIASPARSLHINDILRLEPTSEPGSPSAGDIYFDSTTNKLRCYDGTTWNDLW